MIRKNCLGRLGRAASFALIYLLTCTFLTHEMHGQSTPSVGSVLKPASPPPFLVAPSISLGYSPTSIAAGHLTSSGRLDLVAADVANGNITVYTGLGGGTFSLGASYVAGAQPSSLVIADIDGDGRADVILANQSEGVISVFAGNGDGTLASRKTYAVGFAPSIVAVGDFSGSGKPDIAVAGPSRTLAILQNDGVGSLQRPVNLSLSNVPTAMAVADFNHDGHPDLAIATTNGTVSILLGRGNGQFTALPDITIGAGSLSSIAVGDFNRDGNDDLVVTSIAQNQIAVLLGQGDGNFVPPAFFSVGDSPIATHVADVDGDGIPDLIVLNKGSNTFSVLNGVGDGSFKSAAHFLVGNTPLGVVAGDFYGNGHVDIATINQSAKTLSIPAGNGDGTFGAGRAYAAGSQPMAVASGDLDGDGQPDLVVANYCAAEATCGATGGAAVLLAGPDGGYQVGSTYPMGVGTNTISLIDVNGDKKPDLVALNREDKTLSVRLGTGNGTFGKLITIPLTAPPVALAAADFDHDGNVDLAVLLDCAGAQCSAPGAVEVLVGSGDGNFRSASTFTVGYAPVALAVGATTGSGIPDLVIANRCGADASCQSGGTATILMGNGKGAFRPGKDFALGNSPASIALANLSGSGVLDLVVSRSADNAVVVLPGTGKGSFQAAVPYPVGNAPGTLVVADFNGDGKPDVAVANTADATVSVMLGRGDGTLQPAFPLAVSGNPASLAAIGATRTGHASLATVNGSLGSPTLAASLTVIENLQPRPAVGTATPTVTLSSSPNSSNVDQAVTLTATVTGASGTPSGSITFNLNGTALADCSNPVTIDAAGKATCTLSSLPGSSTGLSLTADYSGDSKYNTGTSNTVTQIVHALTPMITLDASPSSPSAVNTSVTFTATLTGVTLSPVTPTGTMTFALNNSTITSCTGTVSSTGAAACTIQNMHGGSNGVTATYSGDSSYTVSTPGSATYSMTALTPTLSITASPGSSVTVGTPVSFTAALTGVDFSPVAPSGTVTFSINGNSSADCPSVKVNASQKAICTTQSLLYPADTIVATYSGDVSFTVSSSTQFPESVTKTTPAVLLMSSSTATTVNHPVTFTAIVPATAGQTTAPFPTGSVTFMQGATVLCSNAQVLSTPALPLSTTNQPKATCTASFSSANNFPVIANYSGDGNYAAASSTTVTEAVSGGPTTTTLSFSGTPVVNQAVAFSATVVPADSGIAVPQGTVSFLTTAATPPTGTCPAGVTVTTNGTVPSCTFTFGGAGNITVTAKFTPSDSNFILSASSATPVSIGAANVNVALASSKSASSVNEQVALTASFTPLISGTQPTGTVTYSEGTTAICAAAPVSGGVIPPCNHTFTTAGPHTITASFASGDGNFKSANSAPFTQTVNQAGTSTSVISSLPGGSSVNQGVTFTATVTPSTTGSAVPGGTVIFGYMAAGATSPTGICGTGVSVTTSGLNATASCTVSLPAASTYTITANYSGDNNFLPGTAGSIGQPVMAASTSTSLSASPATAVVNQPVTLTASVTPAFTGATSPTGKVDFTDATTGSALCSAVQLKTGTATCSATFNTARAGDSISAIYSSGDGNFSGSTAAPVIQVIGKAPTNLTMVSSLPNGSIATQSVTFTATLVPTPLVSFGGPSPSGTIIFTLGNDPVDKCPPITLANNATPPYTATCTVAISSMVTAGSITVNAIYAGDGNFSGASASQLQQSVANFSLAFTSPASGIMNLTQNVTSTTTPLNNTDDPFMPQNISATVTPIGGLTDKLDVACQVANGTTGQIVSDPICTLSQPISNANGTLSYSVTLSASPQATIGPYSVVLTAVDHNLQSLVQATPTPLSVYVIGVSGTLTLAQTGSGTAIALFDTAAAKSGTLTGFSCATIVPTPTAGSITCTGPSGGASITPVSTTAGVTISLGSTTAATVQRSNGLYLASLMGLPLLALWSWLGTRHPSQRTCFRIIGLLLLAVGLTCVTACGGSFSRPTTPAATGVTPGSYLVQVKATDGANTYFAVVPLVVNGN